MFKRILREFYLLPPGEQRALLLVSLLLILGIAVRLSVQLVPGKEPPDMDRFIEDARILLADLEGTDTLETGAERRWGSDSVQGPRGGGADGKPIAAGIRVHAPLSINSADSTQLLPLPGIGPVFAGRIIRYRNLLGGFVTVEQLHEIYGLPAETVHRIAPLLLIDPSGIRKLDLNEATFSELLRHPYLQYEDVKSLVSYRDLRGRILSLEEIREQNLLPDSILLRAGPYLTP